VRGHYIPPPITPEEDFDLKRGCMVGDLGNFGRGAYFSQYPQYVLPYIRDGLVLQLSWVLPGRIFPVIEPITGLTTLHGQPCVPGFNSHYTLTGRGGEACGLDKTPHGDELVVFNSNQILPRYLVF